MANPELIWVSDEDGSYEEGCLSLPEHYAEVVRPAAVKVRYLDHENEIRELEADGKIVSAGAQPAEQNPDEKARAPEPGAGYAAMRRKGMSHHDVIEELARRVLDVTDQGHQFRLERAGDAKFTI